MAKPPTDSPVVGFPMYDYPWLRDAYRALWAGLRDRLRDMGLRDAPEKLTWKLPEHDLWTHRNLLLTQTCGYPLETTLKARVRPIAIPTYDLEETSGGNYCSLLVVRADDEAESLVDLKGRRAAFNKTTSHSGYNIFRRVVADVADGKPFFSGLKTTDRHLGSMIAVADGEADVAAIDAVSFHLIERGQPNVAAKLRVLGVTPAAPALPFITSIRRVGPHVKMLTRAMMDLVGDMELRPALDTLMIKGFQVPGPGVYERMIEIEREAVMLGYPDLP